MNLKKYYTKEKNSVKKDHRLYQVIYMNCPQQANLHRQKAN